MSTPLRRDYSFTAGDDETIGFGQNANSGVDDIEIFTTLILEK